MRAVVFDIDGTLFELYDADGQQLDQAIGILEAGEQAATFNLSPGVDELLPILRRMGVKIGVFANAPAKAAAYLDNAGIRRYIDAVVSGDDVSNPLPHPEGLHATLKQLEVEPSDAALIGGTELGVQAGKNAGMAKIIALARNEELRDALREIGPDDIIHDIPSLLDVLE